MRVALRQGGADEIQRGSTNIWGTLSAEYDVVVRWQILGSDVGNVVANCGALVECICVTSVMVGRKAHQYSVETRSETRDHSSLWCIHAP